MIESQETLIARIQQTSEYKSGDPFTIRDVTRNVNDYSYNQIKKAIHRMYDRDIIYRDRKQRYYRPTQHWIHKIKLA